MERAWSEVPTECDDSITPAYDGVEEVVVVPSKESPPQEGALDELDGWADDIPPEVKKQLWQCVMDMLTSAVRWVTRRGRV